MRNPASLCGVPSNCRLCRSSPAHRRAMGWPDVCPRGYSESDFPEIAADRIRQERQRHLCRSVDTVTAYRDCCGGQRRPTRIRCGEHGDLPYAACLSCAGYQPGEIPAKQPRAV